MSPDSRRAVQLLRQGLRCITAPNPSRMTASGTNTYLLGLAELAIIDPGPDDGGHFDRIMQEVGAGNAISRILVTHAHLDHTALAPRLARATGAELLGWSPSAGLCSPRLQELAAAIDLGGGEGMDRAFRPDRTLADGETISSSEWTIEAVRTPGHTGDHLCFAWPERSCMFTGDHVMGWSTTLVSPPDGDMGAYMRSLQKLMARPEGTYFPGHGGPILDPRSELQSQHDHRLAREHSIVACLRPGPATVTAITMAIYQDLHPGLARYAERNVLAHLLDLLTRGRVQLHEGSTASHHRFSLLD